MPQDLITKDDLDKKLSYFIDNFDDLGIVVYAILKDSPIPKKMDIEGDAQSGLKKLFLDNIKNNIIENDELNIIQLSSSDERTKVIYQYDLDVPEELSVISSVLTNKEFPDFNFKQDVVDNIKVLLIEIGDNVEQIVLYKTMASVNIFTRSSFFLKKSKTRFDKINEDFFRISDGFQIMQLSSGLFVINLETIEKLFGFHEVIKREATQGMAAIEAKNIVSNMDVLKELIDDVKYARKLTKVAKASPVLKADIENNKIIQFCQIYPSLKGRIRFNEDKTQIVLDTKVSKDLFIKLLMDDFLTSQLTDFYYNSIAKDTVDVVEHDNQDVA
ncbi:DUF4868 domain-containing protein [Yersinia enterocolitica]|uniref:anti-phage protein KwaB n=1 Tax=Yersinia enterocolitica TaxID=630 RepID=UPI0005DC47AE|nr:anti-phage protein KwaB [Yersinia enterocolitica]EKN6077656.1 DUF4868 domain-containing protein [Yersinia enterocolitica]EKN6112075.1 DUF4868 domain-containing protein [Yersinia enterocolitica]UYJ78036.1 DUF4868 domain-containing protein [Yersinia enterocolitica]CNF22343.1 Uncharacterised protein [Yersinia enterocolitica]